MLFVNEASPEMVEAAGLLTTLLPGELYPKKKRANNRPLADPIGI
jgi:hypothetical protein